MYHRTTFDNLEYIIIKDKFIDLKCTLPLIRYFEFLKSCYLVNHIFLKSLTFEMHTYKKQFWTLSHDVLVILKNKRGPK